MKSCRLSGARPAIAPNKNTAALDDFVCARDKARASGSTPKYPPRCMRVKSRCALEGREMTQVVIDLLEQRFPTEREDPHTD